ncbi:hypothetical protein BLNAU_23049 [Blattamonas nauphoetae]|uniref:Uncharacterized protein n=1 Tax=Blattamonas nauphoetae TaxID=2049346 RepID=A0ABQ9WRB4_9EUKA|nr:hypothetical protein BLNAU_23049 [Blattamonas nauphoetae]
MSQTNLTRQPTLMELRNIFQEKQRIQLRMQQDQTQSELSHSPQNDQNYPDESDSSSSQDDTSCCDTDDSQHLPSDLSEDDIQKFQRWISYPKFIFDDGLSLFTLSTSGITCRICAASQSFLQNSRHQYVTKPAVPSATNSLHGHITSKTHKEALKRWMQAEQAINDIAAIDIHGIDRHRQNQVRACHYVAKRLNPIADFKSLTDLLNSTDNEQFVTDSEGSDDLEDSIRFIHKITKSHSNQNKFRKLIDSANLQPRKLTKPVKTRWITCRSALSETLLYRDIILQVLADDRTEKTIQLCATMSNPENLLRIASIVLLLNRTSETNNLLQRTSISLADSKTVIDSLRVELGSLTSDVVRTELQQTLTALHFINFEPFMPVVVDECIQMAQSLRERLLVRFQQPDESSDLNFISHEFMLTPHSPETDYPILSLASRFPNFIEDDLKPEIVDHWHHMKSLYRLNFSAGDWWNRSISLENPTTKEQELLRNTFGLFKEDSIQCLLDRLRGSEPIVSDENVGWFEDGFSEPFRQYFIPNRVHLQKCVMDCLLIIVQSTISENCENMLVKVLSQIIIAWQNDNIPVNSTEDFSDFVYQFLSHRVGLRLMLRTLQEHTLKWFLMEFLVDSCQPSQTPSEQIQIVLTRPTPLLISAIDDINTRFSIHNLSRYLSAPPDLAYDIDPDSSDRTDLAFDVLFLSLLSIVSDEAFHKPARHLLARMFEMSEGELERLLLEREVRRGDLELE